jgi:NAD(P)-dependent dehydrogenase (short-subunit alcohol dehydrogenase family)
VHLTRTLAARWGRYNINVNSISPGYVGRTMTGGNRSAQERQQLREQTPLGYVQRLADLHGPVVFLAAEASDFMTGQHLVVDGGHTLSTWLTPLDRAVPPRVDPAGELQDCC